MKTYDNFPISTVLIVNLMTLLLYSAGAFIMFTLNPITGALYLLFVVILEVNIYREACVSCFYFGKFCAFGRGKISSLLFKKGDPKKFKEREIKFKDLIPQILVIAIPLLVGIALLVSRGINYTILAATIYLPLSWFIQNPVVYGKLACPHCKQGKICCPALEFFMKKTRK